MKALLAFVVLVAGLLVSDTAMKQEFRVAENPADPSVDGVLVAIQVGTTL